VRSRAKSRVSREGLDKIYLGEEQGEE